MLVISYVASMPPVERPLPRANTLLLSAGGLLFLCGVLYGAGTEPHSWERLASGTLAMPGWWAMVGALLGYRTFRGRYEHGG